MAKSKVPPKELWVNIGTHALSIDACRTKREAMARHFNSELGPLRYVLAPQPKPARKSTPARARSRRRG